MKLNEAEVNDYLRPFLDQREDNFQQAWVEILECDPSTLEEITPIIRRVRSKAIKQYFKKKYREESLYKPIGRDGDETFTLESILASPGNEDAESAEDKEEEINGLYRKIITFLMGECSSLRNENLKLRGRDIELKAERLKLRRESLRFRKDRFESWKKLMEDKTRQKEEQFRLRVRLQREKLRFRKEQLYLKGSSNNVIPEKAGIQKPSTLLDSGVRRSDEMGVLRGCLKEKNASLRPNLRHPHRGRRKRPPADSLE